MKQFLHTISLEYCKYLFLLTTILNDFSTSDSFSFKSSSLVFQIYFQIARQKLVHARYCERFPVVKWKDGRVVHVQVTPEVHRGYEERVQVALNKVQQRWVHKSCFNPQGVLKSYESFGVSQIVGCVK